MGNSTSAKPARNCPGCGEPMPMPGCTRCSRMETFLRSIQGSPFAAKDRRGRRSCRRKRARR